MCDLIFIDDPDDIYIHPVVEKFNKMGLEEKEDIDEYGLVQKEHKYKIISIDIGITHLGFSLGITDKAFNLIHLEWVDMIDITKYTHNYDLYNKECGIDHSSNQFADWLQHFFLEYKTLFDISDYILIEKQPPKGLVVVEQIIMFNYREKCHLVHPRSMHSFFGIGSTNINGKNSYEERKKQTQIIAQRCADWHPRALDYYSKLHRKHDVTDAICLMLFWLKQQNKIYTREENIRRMSEVKMNKSNMSSLEYLEQFRYIQY